MIKTFNINLAGQIFNINEDAYEQLLSYFNSLEKFYENEEGKDEILSDIKSRFAEIFLSKGKNYIITIEDANAAINNMGKPEEFEDKDTDDKQVSDKGTSYDTTAQYSTSFGKGKRLYRDQDNALVAGVCSGISNYFGINDPVWMRLAFIIMVFVGFGSPFLIYLILWIAIPEATTSAQKLEMRGEQINLSNIEKKVKDEFTKVSDNVNKNGKGVLGQIVAFIGIFVKLFFKIILGLGGFLLALVGGAVILGLLIAAFVVGLMSIFGIPFVNHFFFINNADGWMLGIGGLLICIIPVIIGVVALIHLLSKNTKPLRKQIVLPLLGLFLLGILLVNISGYHAKQLVNVKQKFNQTFALNNANSLDTLQLTINPTMLDKHYDEVNFGIHGSTDLIEFITTNEDFMFPIEIEIYPSLNDSFSVVQEFASNGKDKNEALQNASLIRHNIIQKGNRLIIDPYIDFDKQTNKYRNQKLRLKVFVPEGKVIRWDDKTEDYIDLNAISFNWDNIKFAPIPPMPPAPPTPPTAQKINIQADSNSIVINIQGNKNLKKELKKAQEKLDAVRDKLENDEGIDINIDEQDQNNDSLEDIFESRLHREHYIFRMVNGNLVPID
ncbi:MAG: PspC domain-containing protein [Chitinophagales bacterium]